MHDRRERQPFEYHSSRTEERVAGIAGWFGISIRIGGACCGAVTRRAGSLMRILGKEVGTANLFPWWTRSYGEKPPCQAFLEFGKEVEFQAENTCLPNGPLGKVVCAHEKQGFLKSYRKANRLTREATPLTYQRLDFPLMIPPGLCTPGFFRALQ